MSEPQVSLVRPFDFTDREYHLNKWKEKDITVLICQRNTIDLIKLTLESILRFYPDIPILIMDGGSKDDSINYLRYKAMLHPNITIVEGKDKTSVFTSHGVTMDIAIKNHIKTKYVLLCDSDVIVERGGLIEEMMDKMKAEGIYAIGSLMLVTKKNHACGPPLNEKDVLRYAHPSFSIYDAQVYNSIKAPFVDHGAPCCYNMIEAEKRALKVEYYPVEKYVSHLSGGSWTEPRTIWSNDHDVFIRPFVTFITNNSNHLIQLQQQTDHDYDVVTVGNIEKKFIVVHGSLPETVNNNLYSIRHNVYGEYICHISSEIETIQPEFVHIIKHDAINQNMPEEMLVGGLKCIKRSIWQKRESFK